MDLTLHTEMDLTSLSLIVTEPILLFVNYVHLHLLIFWLQIHYLIIHIIIRILYKLYKLVISPILLALISYCFRASQSYTSRVYPTQSFRYDCMEIMKNMKRTYIYAILFLILNWSHFSLFHYLSRHKRLFIRGSIYI